MDILSNLKKMVVEPKIYTLLVRSPRALVLHLGIHFTLDEAYSVACKNMNGLTPHQPGEPMDIDMWNSLPIRQIIAQSVDPSKAGELFPFIDQKEGQGTIIEATDFPAVIQSIFNRTTEPLKKMKNGSATLTEQIEDMKETKNNLMKKLISNGDIEQVDKLKDLLDANSRRYVLKQIEAKKVLEELEKKPDDKK